MKARQTERRFLAYFFAAVGKEVRRQQAKLRRSASDYVVRQKQSPRTTHENAAYTIRLRPELSQPKSQDN